MSDKREGWGQERGFPSSIKRSPSTLGVLYFTVHQTTRLHNLVRKLGSQEKLYSTAQRHTKATEESRVNRLASKGLGLLPEVTQACGQDKL